VVSALDLVGQIPDPEIPAVTLHDLGIVRTVKQTGNAVFVSLTPTYSGCPATEAIKQQVHDTLAAAGYTPITVQVTLEPAWSTEWITAQGRAKLKQYGIAPPHQMANAQQSGCQLASQSNTAVTTPLQFFAPAKGVACPRCDSFKTEQISRFGSTPCKAHYRCLACLEPFDYFKPL
jgi:ring-1,2-phenylacetyl-CoA epoxidase subunit PaaD